MCGRFALVTNEPIVRAQFHLDELPELLPRFNIAPSQPVLFLVEVDHQLKALQLTWGLVPFWAKNKKIGSKMINAHCETITSKPAFRQSFKTKRGLLLMSGFYEWHETKNKPKQPFFITRNDNQLLAIAGLWDSWQSEDGQEVVQSCCLITTEANRFLRPIRNRMPVILTEKEQTLWLDTDHYNQASLLSLLKPYDIDDLKAYPVSTRVNNARYEEVDAIRPIQDKQHILSEQKDENTATSWASHRAFTLKKGSPMAIPKAFASFDLAITQPSLKA